MPSRIHCEYSQSWKAALYNNTKLVLREVQVVEKQTEKYSIFHGQRKGTLLRKCTNKDTFRCLIAIWCIGIARRGLNELIFVKTSISTKIDIFHLFCL